MVVECRVGDEIGLCEVRCKRDRLGFKCIALEVAKGDRWVPEGLWGCMMYLLEYESWRIWVGSRGLFWWLRT